ncbi:MAG: hypothetical protein QGH42_04290 [Kiritimatiellia bacterium]|jgi:hypothetical protein|nr:hypothetical protein [Kiritimatiellia bacterium]MDP7023455.1 hypothetical protein [Kiritimatiellia bacterium]
MSTRTVIVWIWKKTGLLCATAVLVLVIGDIQTRLPFIPPRLEYQPDRELKGIFKPEQHGFLWLANQSMKSLPMTVNRDGYRGADTDWSRKDVLALGSSESFGTGVRDDEVWTAVLQKMLNDGQAAWSVANVGGPGLGAYQQDEVLRRIQAKSIRPDVILVRVSIGDRNFGPIPEHLREGQYQASLKRHRIRRITTFLPYLYSKVQVQIPSMKRACRPIFMQPPIIPAYYGERQAGEEMADKDTVYWEQMVTRAEAMGSTIVFLVHDPHGFDSSAVLLERLEALCRNHAGARVVQLGPAVYGMDRIPAEQREVHFNQNLTLVRDPHANALQHRLTGEAVGRWLRETRILDARTSEAL